MLNYLLMGTAGGAVWLSAILAIPGYKMATISYLALASAVAAWGENLATGALSITSRMRQCWKRPLGLDSSVRFRSSKGYICTPTTCYVRQLHVKKTGYLLARKHPAKIRQQAQAVVNAPPLILITCAEAKHVATLYYDAKSA